MKLQLGFLAANVLADWSMVYVYYELEDFDYTKEADYYSRVPVTEVYRYSDNTLVASLNREKTLSKGFYTGLLTNYDRKSMYFKIVAPFVRLTMTSLPSFESFMYSPRST